jgi:hypothetical protein
VTKWQFQHTLTGGTLAYTHWFSRYTGTAPVANDMNNMCGSLSSAWNTNLAPLATAGVTLIAVNGTDLSAPTGAQGSNVVSHVGTRAGAGLPANACMLIDQKIQRRYRGGKPRQYWPLGAGTDLQNSTLWTTAFQTSVNAAINAMVTAILALTWTGGNMTQIVNVSYFQGFTSVQNPVTHRYRNVPTLRPTPVIDPVTTPALLGLTRRPGVATRGPR